MAAANIVESASESVVAEQLRSPIEASFNLYGTGLTLVSEVASLVESLIRDFAYFVAPAQPGAIRIVAHANDPPWSRTILVPSTRQ